MHTAESGLPPIFIGGTGRSGTTVLGDLFGSHPSYATVPIEMRFHTQPSGLTDLFTGRATLDEFAAQMLGTFYRWHSPDGQRRGLHLIMERDQFEGAVHRFVERFPDDRTGAARKLFGSLIAPTLAKEGKPGWVEMTPANVVAAETILEIFPEARIVNTVRDGRDAAISVARMPWGPDNPIDGLLWWNLWMRRAGATARELPPEAIYCVRFERLVEVDRQGTLRDLCGYLGIDQADVLEFFETEMQPDRANLGRWARDLDHDEAGQVDRMYLEMYHDLIAAGVRCRPISPFWRENSK